MAKLYFRYGVMGCGKSTHLLQTIYNYESKNMPILLLKPAIDTKGDRKIVSRLGCAREVDELVYKDDSIGSIFSSCPNKPSCILVDEAQFMDTDQIDELYKISKLEDIPVITYGLKCDFQMSGFPGSTRLLQLADDLEELKTICQEPGCQVKATQNLRLANGIPVFDGEQVLIDGTESITYIALCGKHYLMKKDKYEGEQKRREDDNQ